MTDGKTIGIILQSKAFFEKDRVVTVFTEAHGLIRVLVKGASSTSFRYGARLEPLTYVHLTLRKGKSFYYLSSVDILDAFSNLKKDYNRLQFAFYCCDVLKKLCVFEQTNMSLLTILLDTCKGLDSGHSYTTLHRSFCLNVLKSEGLIAMDRTSITEKEFEKLFVAYTGSPLVSPRFITAAKARLNPV